MRDELAEGVGLVQSEMLKLLSLNLWSLFVGGVNLSASNYSKGYGCFPPHIQAPPIGGWGWWFGDLIHTPPPPPPSTPPSQTINSGEADILVTH